MNITSRRTITPNISNQPQNAEGSVQNTSGLRTNVTRATLAIEQSRTAQIESYKNAQLQLGGALTATGGAILLHTQALHLVVAAGSFGGPVGLGLGLLAVGSTLALDALRMKLTGMDL